RREARPPRRFADGGRTPRSGAPRPALPRPGCCPTARSAAAPQARCAPTPPARKSVLLRCARVARSAGVVRRSLLLLFLALGRARVARPAGIGGRAGLGVALLAALLGLVLSLLLILRLGESGRRRRDHGGCDRQRGQRLRDGGLARFLRHG